MSIGATHLLRGDLQLFGARLRLRTADGDVWRLNGSPRGYGFVGRTVELKATRVDSDELDVEWIAESHNALSE